MPVNGLNHVNICTNDVARSARYYVELLDLEARNAPGPLSAEQVQWLYDRNGQAIIHLYKFEREQGSTGVIHHVALNCSGKAKVIERLKSAGAKFDTRDDPSGAAIVYTRDPHGLMLELYFPGD
jgi:catechol 2,3-dioxygenase-like lactoylglutathione lyase family enzyme